MFAEGSYKKILVPVDFSINTEVAVKKTLELINGDEAVVHLLHVAGYKNQGRSSNPNLLAEEMLERWKNTIRETHPPVPVYNEIVYNGSVQQAIADKAKQCRADLIVVGQKSNHSWFPFLNTVMPVELAEASECAVLTVKPGALYNKIRTVVMPVTNNVTEFKMQALATLCKKFKVRIHLITFTDDERTPGEDSTSSLLRIYQWLKDSLHCPVEYAVLRGYNKPKAILSYSQKIDADVLLVNASTETKVGRLNTHISDLLPAASRMQVLTVQTKN